MGSAASHTMSAREWTLLLALSVLWGGSFLFAGIAVREVPVLTLVAARVAIAALVLNGVVQVLGGRMPTDRTTWLAFVGMGVLNNVVPFCLIVWGQTQIASGLAAILNATTPLWGVLVAHLLTDDEKLTANRFAGVLVGLVGVAVMVGQAMLLGLGSDLLAQLAVIGAGMSYAVSSVYGRRFRRMGLAPLATASGQLTASSVMLVPLAMIVDRPWSLAFPSAPVAAAILALALVSTALAYVIFFRVLATAGATNIMLVTLLVPVSAILLGTVVLGERTEPRQIVGMGLIGLGLAAIDGRLPAAARAGLRLVRTDGRPRPR